MGIQTRPPLLRLGIQLSQRRHGPGPDGEDAAQFLPLLVNGVKDLVINIRGDPYGLGFHYKIRQRVPVDRRMGQDPCERSTQVQDACKLCCPRE